MKIRFDAMTDADFQMYMRKAIPEYANAQVQSGNWHADEAIQRAKEEYQRVLPEGPKSPGQFLYVLADEEKNDRVGMLWYTIDATRLKKKAFLADLFIFSESRRKGYESAVLKALEAELGSKGIERVEVHLFAQDRDEQAMYEQDGFEVASLFLGKDLKKEEK